MVKDGEQEKGPRAAKKEYYARWMKTRIGKQVEVYQFRAPKVHGTLRAVDPRFGKIMVENDEEDIEISLSDVAQVRYPKEDAQR